MQINLYCFRNNINLEKNKSFYYIGTDFLKYDYLSKKYKEHKFDFDLKTISEREKNSFLKWTEKNRQLNNDSIYWWLTSIGSKNNLFSKFYDILCQFRKLELFISKKKNSEPLNLVCEDEYITLFVFHNLKKKNKCIINNDSDNSFIRINFIKIKYTIKKIYLILKLIIFSKLTKFKRKVYNPKGEVLLFHNCLNKNFKIKDKTIVCNYFGMLPNLLKKKNFEVYSLPWIPIEMTNLFYFFRLSLADRVFIPDDYLNISDYFKILKISNTQIKNLKIKKKYKKLDLSKLVEREKSIETREMHFIFLRYFKALKKWSNNIKKLVVYDHYENLQFEHPLRNFCKSKNNFYSVGYYHSYVSNQFLSYQHNPSEWNSSFKPDRIVTHSIFGKKLLIKQGVPSNIIKTGSNFRSHSITVKKKKKKKILVPLSLDKNSNFEIIKNLEKLNDLFLKKNKISVTIRPHPMYEAKKQIKILKKLSNFPDNWKISNNLRIEDDISESKCAITLSTASAFNCIKFELPVFCLKSKFTVLSNYMDFLPKDNFLSRSFNINEIIRLLQITFNKEKNFLQKDVLKAKKALNLDEDNENKFKTTPFLI